MGTNSRFRQRDQESTGGSDPNPPPGKEGERAFPNGKKDIGDEKSEEERKEKTEEAGGSPQEGRGSSQRRNRGDTQSLVAADPGPGTRTRTRTRVETKAATRVLGAQLPPSPSISCETDKGRPGFSGGLEVGGGKEGQDDQSVTVPRPSQLRGNHG